ncbi:hypothetical protein D6445_11850 [Salmonella enterica subsp. enterica serovar Infantis]|nr:hypothetical protein [Salmonella enterica subsp. enterica serovar Infantis]
MHRPDEAVDTLFWQKIRREGNGITLPLGKKIGPPGFRSPGFNLCTDTRREYPELTNVSGQSA